MRPIDDSTKSVLRYKKDAYVEGDPMTISPVSNSQVLLQMLQYQGQLASAVPSMSTTQMITGNTASSTAGLIDSVGHAIPGTNTLNTLLANANASQSNLNSLFNQLA